VQSICLTPPPPKLLIANSGLNLGFFFFWRMKANYISAAGRFVIYVCFIEAAIKTTRKTLLANLKGNRAFRGKIKILI